MQTLIESRAAVNLAVIFSNGANASKPWQVVIKEGRAIVDQLGAFSAAQTAIKHAQSLAKLSVAPVYLTLPAWLEVA